MHYFYDFFPDCRLCPYYKLVHWVRSSGQSHATKYYTLVAFLKPNISWTVL